ncbi:hypothetical protein PROVALCAL_03300 [Providencia alcalifaciens DSM 30120]|uniref:Uncharacterized protein n=1 Tax=Providencia alcalifaciens DSM 30120 TaxID=520999 RepID=B6XIV1_9GAMM|nr:hypothetical protein PROVALCAL_03300 [Providencia alcalifaciens DSM 30120]
MAFYCPPPIESSCYNQFLYFYLSSIFLCWVFNHFRRNEKIISDKSISMLIR